MGMKQRFFISAATVFLMSLCFSFQRAGARSALTACPAGQMLVGVSRLGKGGRCVPPPLAMGGKVTFLSANIGNVDVINCGGLYVYKLCRVSVEEALTRNLAALSPDVVLLQEVLQTRQCRTPAGARPGTVCHPSAGADQTAPDQITRLLGQAYDHRCAEGFYECVGLKKSGGWAFAGPLVAVPPPAGCDSGFSFSYVDATGPLGPVRLVNGHPDSASPACRRAHLQAVFEGAAKEARQVLVAGDMNLDPFHAVDQKNGQPGQDDESEAYWNAMAGAGKGFVYLSEDGAPPLVWTNSTGVLDHVLSKRGGPTGGCLTLDSAQAPLLDGGQGGLDHHALWCGLGRGE